MFMMVHWRDGFWVWVRRNFLVRAGAIWSRIVFNSKSYLYTISSRLRFLGGDERDYQARLWRIKHKQDCLQQPAGADDRVGTIRVQLLGVQQQHASLSVKKINSSSTSLDEVGHCSRRSSVLRSP
ncbi:hypothetical protein CAPTEDRAFT_205351 [Capitella teleta]|uniref:Uncharacterized protein n=1 Tax=Capitella teleta TaxID=283909 RepID=R7TMW7_CAPTE|nr:hypothetical protein CAPTEDRAFT_205351 [Capitella teleta]|eukprot:ELT94852.1 hypothetical protein CAPTEDRAFT_205351 [Capitella teleta]